MFGAFGLFMAAVGGCCVLYLSRRTVQEQFKPQVAEAGNPPALLSTQTADFSQTPLASATLSNQRPVSLTVVAILLLVGAASFPLVFWLHSPVLFCGIVLRGVAALTCLAIYAAINLYIGVGLLKLWPRARVAGIVYLLFGILNASLTFFGRWSATQFHEIIAAQSNPFGPAPDFVYPRSFIVMIGAMTIVITLVQLYFLVTRKAAFERREGPATLLVP